MVSECAKKCTEESSAENNMENPDVQASNKKTSKKTRKRLRNPENWTRNVKKVQLEHVLQYKQEKEVDHTPRINKHKTRGSAKKQGKNDHNIIINFFMVKVITEKPTVDAKKIMHIVSMFAYMPEFDKLDESTLPNNESLLLAYVRFIKSEKICQELLFVRTLKRDTKGKSIFDVLEHYFTDKGIPLENVITVATYGAPAMVGRHRGLIAYLKKAVPNILAVHCVIHRQHLVAKNLSDRLHCSLQYVITAVSKIRSSALNDRLLGKLCDENDENFNRLLLHTEVRWLSKGTCLKRFYDLFDSVLEFFESKDDSLRDNLLKFKSDIAYLTDLYDKFNETNLQLQGDNLNLIKATGTISSFVSKLNLYRQNLGRRQFHQFQNLSSVETNDEDILVYCQHLEALQEDFRNRFQDILGLIIPDWVLEPFSSLETAELSLQEELIELSTNEELKVKFKNGYQEFWLQCQISVLYPALWATSKKFFIAFPSSYLAERRFSIVSNLLTKKRNRLSIVERGDLRLLMTSMEPNIDRLLSLHQAQPSH
ncbi:SCAN domain-containing protein 3-like [Diabrotica undecimpunctata]|uniref:SCAN domain-containing protein 3-like n=1 Tax=Diabrotica undecimpunctata TaxID=50387 RepID=UPI003B639EB7